MFLWFCNRRLLRHLAASRMTRRRVNDWILAALGAKWRKAHHPPVFVPAYVAASVGGGDALRELGVVRMVD